MRIILLTLGIIGIIWFAIPLFVASSLNIGNATGIVIFLCMLMYAIAMKKTNEILIHIWKTRWGKVGYAIITGFVLTVALFAICGTVSMYQAAQKRPALKATTIVLGCRVYGEQPSLMLQKRLEAAYEYLVINPDTICILSGGQGPGEEISEAECMYRYLVERGISPERLIKEDKSTSTRENITFSKKIMEEQGLNIAEQEIQITIVTNEFHQYRAARIAEELQLESGAVCGETPWWLFPTYYVRELYGIVYEWTGNYLSF